MDTNCCVRRFIKIQVRFNTLSLNCLTAKGVECDKIRIEKSHPGSISHPDFSCVFENKFSLEIPFVYLTPAEVLL